MNHRSTDQDCESTQRLHYLSKEEAVAMEMELLRDYHFGLHQLTEILGHACAVAITKAFPLSTLGKRQPTILVVCGPDQNGCIGLACARYLRLFEYMPTVFYPKRSSQNPHLDFTVQCEKMDIPFLSYLPTEVQLINDAYKLVVDALLGPERELGTAKDPFTSIMLTLRGVKIPIASIDIPSDWDPDEATILTGSRINPKVLISLMAPKRCALSFSGTHFLAGRLLPYDIQKKYELNLPKFPSTDCITELH
ncbi:yjeF N-terminal domain-containing 3-like [Clarias gariepinus]|uniref:yjeF N-terminal domain-containing 3-like n=1 Tax=Clarias gariepinus TaxID=13013 RepID=UPI00234C3E6D|nr:yjeF N-terminal domain-containing 3-like [Clarias gariepinus]